MGKMQWNERLRIVFVSSVLKFNEKLFCIYICKTVYNIYILQRSSLILGGRKNLMHATCTDSLSLLRI